MEEVTWKYTEKRERPKTGGREFGGGGVRGQVDTNMMSHACYREKQEFNIKIRP